ncbi:hypothetical protein RB623_20570 [Mesorhizobium sp. LHD-90]|uniref:hypothetical protein n=1 Tax=Mesorhizobium sp. LHD-90 TaxID=3071414 RepID=UPI0027DFD0FF|nr:hypothetical protein [Mesorhizobium sp. LHD-90]MDQ6436451.1 hypothetical protein [Mesorhizobium sp. LHD-90]
MDMIRQIVIGSRTMHAKCHSRVPMQLPIGRSIADRPGRQWPAAVYGCHDSRPHLQRGIRILHKQAKPADTVAAAEEAGNHRRLIEIPVRFRCPSGDGGHDRGFRHPVGPRRRDVRTMGKESQLIRFFNANHARGA